MAYATVEQLQRRLFQSATPATDELELMQQCLDAAAGACDWEIPFNTDNPAPDDFETSDPQNWGLMHQANLARAVELWREQITGFGIVPLGPDIVPAVAGLDSWRRHSRTLAPVKARYGIWGIA
jgi:hypothetical protein